MSGNEKTSPQRELFDFLSPRKIFGFGICLFIIVVMAKLMGLPGTEDHLISTNFQCRGLQNWRLSWKQVAYCTTQAAAFRGWQAEIGPLMILRIRSTLPLSKIAQPQIGANALEIPAGKNSKSGDPGSSN
jgi:hypothetical protein